MHDAAADAHQAGDVQAHRQSADRVVLGHRGIAELAHLTEDGPGAATRCHGSQRLERGAHGLGVGVVGVVDHRVAARRVVHLHAPPALRRGRAQGHRDVLDDDDIAGVDVEAVRDGRRSQGVEHRVLAVQLQADRHGLATAHQGEGRPGIGVEPDVAGPHLAVTTLAEGDHPRGGAPGLFEDERVVAEHHRAAVRRDGVEDLALGLRDRLARAQHPQVR